MVIKAASAPAGPSSAAALWDAQDTRGRLRIYRGKLLPFTMYPFSAASFSEFFRRKDTSARHPTEVPRALTESNQALSSQLGGAGLLQPDLAQGHLGEHSNSYSLSREDSAATTRATPHGSYSPTTFSTAAYLQGPDLASFTSPECEPGQEKEVNSKDECPTSSSGRSTDGKVQALRTALEKAAHSAPLGEEARHCITRPASGLLVTNSVQAKGKERIYKDSTVDSRGYSDNDAQGHAEEDQNSNTKRRDSSPKLPRDAVLTIPPKARRPKTIKPPTTSAGHRTIHTSRTSRKTGYRTGNNCRALHQTRVPHSPPVKTAHVPEKITVVNFGRLWQGDSGNQGQGNHQAALRAVATTPQPAKRDFFDTEAASDGAEDSGSLNGHPSTKIGKGNDSGPCSSRSGGRHYFFHFPPPDMGNYNRDFDKELEQSRPINSGLNPDLIDKQLDEFAAQTELILGLMRAHQAEFEPVNELFLANKRELLHLNYERQRAITSKYSILNKTTPKQRARILARVAAAETPLLEEQKHVKEGLMEIVIRGRAQVAQIVREDQSIPTTIDEKRARISQRNLLEEQYTELGIAGAMIGLRGNLKEQNYSTHTAILRFAQHVVDERLKAFDEKHSWYKPEKPVSIKPISDVDTVITAVPGWFTILDAKGTVKLRGTTPMDRLKELLQILGTSFNAAREEQWVDELRPKRHAWRKQYHEPDSAWPNALQRSRGGWWACRSGPDASPAERSCKLCHQRVASPKCQVSIQTAKEQYQHILKEIEAAQAEASRKDQLILKYQLEQECEDIDQYWQRREWIRSGGGVDINEELHEDDVNGLNYRPTSSEPSQSFQQPDTPFRYDELRNKHVHDEAFVSPVEVSQNSQPSGSCHISELMSRQQAINETAFPLVVDRSSSPQPLGCSPPLKEPLKGKPASKPSSLSGESSQPPQRLQSSPLFHELLAGRQVNKEPQQVPPPLSLYRFNSSQAHDALHGRLPNNGTPPKTGPSHLRSSMAHPGQKRKKRVSWQL